MIKLTNIDKYFNKGKKNQIHVIDNTSIELPDHGIITFFGHSGSGKTTLLNAIGGLDSFKGTIQYDDISIKNYRMGSIDRFRAKNIGYVFQNYDLLQNESVYDNLAIALSIIGIHDDKEVKNRIEYALKSVGLFKLRKKKAYALSGGQQQRVAIARALVKKCRILIADEPTGNLDSTNTIEVMNILKSISKNTLVLLVTHEQNIAQFYSDKIIEMADGKIISAKENDSSHELIQEDHTNAVYLEDMEKEVEESDSFSFTIYKDADDTKKRDIQIYIKNDTIYVKSSGTIRIANDSSLKIIDGHRKSFTKEENDDRLTYDNSFYDDTKKGVRSFKTAFMGFVSILQSIFSAKRKTKLLYATLAFLGITFSIASASYINNTMIDSSSIEYANGYFTILNMSYNSSSIVNDAFDSGLITKVHRTSPAYLEYKDAVTFAESIKTNIYSNTLAFNSDKVQIEYGRGVQSDNEVVISTTVADDILRSYSLQKDYKYLLGKELVNNYSSDGEKLTIVGLSTNDSGFSYMSEATYQNSVNVFYETQTAILSKSIEAGHYTIVQGVDVSDSNNPECLILDELLEKSPYKLDGSTTIEGYKLVGTFKFNAKMSNKGSNVLITNADIKQTLRAPTEYGSKFTTTAHYIVKGREPKKSNEVVINAYNSQGLTLESGVVDGYSIVGVYSGGEHSQTYTYLFSQDVYNINNEAMSCVFETNDSEAAKQYFKNNDLIFDTMFNTKYQEKVISDQENRAIFYTVFVVTLSIASLFVFFVMRSRMLTEIYTIGVYRSLGSSRWNIVKKYLFESGILTFTFIIGGYTLGCIVYNGFSSMINSLIGVNVIMTSTLACVLIGLIIFVLCTLVGTLPILALFLKTPAQIKTKYDI